MPSTIEDLILLSRFCQSWTNQRLDGLDALSGIFAGSRLPDDFMGDFEFFELRFERAGVDGLVLLASRCTGPVPLFKMCKLGYQCVRLDEKWSLLLRSSLSFSAASILDANSSGSMAQR